MVVVRKGKRRKSKMKKKRDGKCEFCLLKFALDLLEFERELRGNKFFMN